MELGAKKKQLVFLNWWTPRENFQSFAEYLDTIEYSPEKEIFKNWNKILPERLWDDWQFLRAPFLTPDYADYFEWKLIFEKMIPFFWDDMSLCATSLGCTFLMKYLGEQELPVRIKKLFLIAPAIHDTPKEVMGSFAFDFELNYHRTLRAADTIYIYHSTDDAVVPFQQALELKMYFPDAIFRQFDDRGHFYKEGELPELEIDIMS